MTSVMMTNYFFLCNGHAYAKKPKLPILDYENTMTWVNELNDPGSKNRYGFGILCLSSEPIKREPLG